MRAVAVRSLCTCAYTLSCFVVCLRVVLTGGPTCVYIAARYDKCRILIRRHGVVVVTRIWEFVRSILCSYSLSLVASFAFPLPRVIIFVFVVFGVVSFVRPRCSPRRFWSLRFFVHSFCRHRSCSRGV